MRKSPSSNERIEFEQEAADRIKRLVDQVLREIEGLGNEELKRFLVAQSVYGLVKCVNPKIDYSSREFLNYIL